MTTPTGPPPRPPVTRAAPPAAPRRRPGRRTLVVGVVCLVLGVLLAGGGAGGGVVWFVDTVDGYQRVPAAGGGAVTLTAPGTYTVTHEAPGVADGSTPAPRSLRVLGPDGAALPTRATGASETYSLGGREGRALARVDARVPGTYRITAAPGTPGSLAVGDRGIVSPLLLLFGGLLAGFVVGGLGVVLLVVGLVRRALAR